MYMDQFLKFEPILKDKIWGGEKLKNLLGKKASGNTSGESWEISDVACNISEVINGTLQGKNLKELIKTYKGDLVGEAVFDAFGEKFPLLIKFIDARETLSIQLHPNDELAGKRHDSFGKTEMWYILQADENASLIMGFKKEVSTDEYLYHLANKSLTEILNTVKVKKGDVYFIPPGRVHAIGSGVLLAEIQQTSDITYRIYDWDRQDSEGNYRELHTDEALDAIDFSIEKSYKKNYQKKSNTSGQILSCPYFTTHILPVDGKVAIDHSTKDSFVIYMCVEGAVAFDSKHSKEELKKGETILVPNSLNRFSIISLEKSELLEVYIQ